MNLLSDHALCVGCRGEGGRKLYCCRCRCGTFNHRCRLHRLDHWDRCCTEKTVTFAISISVALEGAGKCPRFSLPWWQREKTADWARARVAVGAGEMCGMTGEDATYSITESAGAGVTNSITGAGAVEESDEIPGADSTYSITGLSETVGAGATSSITGSSVTNVTVDATCFSSKCRCHVFGHWRFVHWSCLRGGVGVSAPTSISTTARRDPYRVTQSWSLIRASALKRLSQRSLGTLTAPRHRTLARIGLHAGVLPKTLVASGKTQRSLNQTLQRVSLLCSCGTVSLAGTSLPDMPCSFRVHCGSDVHPIFFDFDDFPWKNARIVFNTQQRLMDPTS